MSGGNAPGPRGEPFLGNLRELQRSGQVRFYLEAWHTYGDLVRFQIGPVVAHLVVHPEAVRRVIETNASSYTRGLGYARLQAILGQGLLTSEGEPWRHARETLEPLFTGESLRPFGAQIMSETEAMLQRWGEVAVRGATLDLVAELLQLSIRILGRFVLGAEAGQAGMAEALVSAYDEASALTYRRLTALVDLPAWLPTPFNRRLARTMHTLDGLVYGVIRSRRAALQDDLVSRLIAAKTEPPLTDKQIRDEVITSFFAGHETTAEAVIWALYLLGRNPAHQERLHAELVSVLGEASPQLDDLARLPFARQVIAESLRLDPPVWTFPRQALQTDELNGYAIPTGSLMVLAPYLTHRHPSFWTRPNEFDPGRFDDAAARSPFTYYPFGYGPRACLGQYLAVHVAELVLASVARRYRLRPAADREIEPKALITLRPSGPIPVYVDAY